MRIDHLAFRCLDKYKMADFFITCFGYRIAEDLPDGFDIQFEDGTYAKCLVLLPPEKISNHNEWVAHIGALGIEYHMAPEIFISDGSDGSIVKQWVEKRIGIGALLHHIAYQVDSVEQTMTEWLEKGYAEFTTDKPLTCPGLKQVFTTPSSLTGIIYEFIERTDHGFCKDNVKNLMNSTKNL